MGLGLIDTGGGAGLWEPGENGVQIARRLEESGDNGCVFKEEIFLKNSFGQSHT